MPRTVTDFSEDTAVELYVLSRAAPLLPPPAVPVEIMLRDSGSTDIRVFAQAAVGVTDAGASDRGLGVSDIWPLLFGAAWKVLDQLVEFGLERAGIAPGRSGRYTIAFKAEQARAGGVPPVSPFDRRADLWSRILKVYASTEELRNAAAHRRLIVDRKTGVMTGTPRPGGLTPAALTADEQTAFCCLAGATAQAVIDNELASRTADQLGWILDQLVAHHCEPRLGVAPVNGRIPVLVLEVPAGSDAVDVDPVDIKARGQRAASDATHFDLRIRLADGRALVGALEDVPAGPVTVQIAAPPAWLHWT